MVPREDATEDTGSALGARNETRASAGAVAYERRVNHLDAIASVLRDVGHALKEAEVVGVREKRPLDVVSDLDLWAETKICEALRRWFPADTILSEESASHVEYADRIWVLDPLDGTVNRTSEVPFYAISLALLENGSPTFGAVYDPVHEELFVATVGGGAHCNGRRLAVAEAGVRGVSLTSGLVQRMVLQNPQGLVDLLGTAGKLRNFGAQALQLAYVAAGRLGGAASTETRLWDNLAGALLVREAGGIYTDLTGRDPFPIVPGSVALHGAANPCIAGAPHVHALLAPALRGLTTDDSGAGAHADLRGR